MAGSVAQESASGDPPLYLKHSFNSRVMPCQHGSKIGNYAVIATLLSTNFVMCLFPCKATKVEKNKMDGDIIDARRGSKCGRSVTRKKLRSVCWPQMQAHISTSPGLNRRILLLVVRPCAGAEAFKRIFKMPKSAEILCFSLSKCQLSIGLTSPGRADLRPVTSDELQSAAANAEAGSGSGSDINVCCVAVVFLLFPFHFCEVRQRNPPSDELTSKEAKLFFFLPLCHSASPNRHTP